MTSTATPLVLTVELPGNLPASTTMDQVRDMAHAKVREGGFTPADGPVRWGSHGRCIRVEVPIADDDGAEGTCVHCEAETVTLDGIVYHARIEDFSHIARNEA